MPKLSCQHLNILYAEDDPFTREEIVFSLEPMIQNVIVAQNGQQGVELFYQNEIDLIITDIQMPVMDGLAMIEKIKQTHPRIPVIVMTAFNDVTYLFKAIELGISHYVTKPASLKSLISKIEEIAEQIFLKKTAQRQGRLLSQYKKAIDTTMSVRKIDLEGNVTYTNDKFKFLSGYTEEEILGTHHAAFRALNEKEEKFDELWSVITRGEIWHGTVEYRSKNGDHFILDQNVFPLYDDKEAIFEYMSIGDDVSELFRYRDLLEVELHQNRQSLAETLYALEQYQAALQVGTAVCQMSLEGKILKANETFCTLLEHTKKSILEINECAICQSEGFEIQNIIGILDTKNMYQKEYRYRTSRGSVRTFDSTFVPIRNISGEIVEILSMHHNITELLELNQEIVDTQHEFLLTLGEVAENKSEETGKHVVRVAAYSRFLAEKYGLSSDEVDMLEMVAPMHDIGKIAIPDAILHKPGELDADEMEVMKEHAIKGYQMFSHSARPVMKYAALVALQHHERYDGSGYPQGLRGEEIDIAGRIVAIADVFDSLGSERVYKRAWKIEDIVNYFECERGKHFDPQLVDIVLDNLDEILIIKAKVEQ